MHGEAKESAEIDSEKEIVDISVVQTMGKDKFGNITQSGLQNALDINAGGEKAKASPNGENFVVQFIESNRFYEVDANGEITGPIEVIMDKNPGDITVGINGEELKGTEESPYEIWCIEDLVAFSENQNTLGAYTNSVVKLCATLNFNSILSYADYTTTKYDTYLGGDGTTELMTQLSENGKGFIPIGNSANKNFGGSFNGQGNKIQNIYINVEENAGLFGNVFYATIENVSISGKIISDKNNAGAFIGVGCVTIKNCSNEAMIKANKYAGGIIGNGSWQTVLIENCYNTGYIYSATNFAGGIAATFSGKIYNCYNLGNIEGSAETAGILVESQGKVEIINCYNCGDVKSKSSKAAGIISYPYAEVIVNNCYNIGKITAEGIFSARGIGGSFANNCYNIGELKSKEFYAIGAENIKNCYADFTIVGETEDNEKIQDISKLDKDEFVELLNSYSEEETGLYPIGWKKWILGENGYPVFK